MPRVPRIYGQRATQRQIGVPRVQTQQSPDAYGAGLGKAMFDIALNEQTKANKFAADQFLLDAERDQKVALYGDDKTPGLMLLEGESFLNAASSIKPALTASIDEKFNALTEAQRELARPYADRLKMGFETKLAEREAVQREAKYQAIYDATLASRVEAAALDPSPASVRDELSLATAAIREQAMLHPGTVGPDPASWKEGQLQRVGHEIVTTAIDAAVQRGDHQTAAALMESFGDRVQPQQREAVRQAVGDAGALGTVQEKIREVMPGLPDLSADATPAQSFADTRKAFGEWAQANLSPAWQEKAMQRFDVAHEAATEQARQIQIEKSVGLVSQIEGGVSLPAIQNTEAFRALDKQQRVLVEQTARAVEKGRDEAAAFEWYQRFEEMVFSDNPEVRRKAMTTDLRQYRVLLGPRLQDAMALQSDTAEGLALKAGVQSVVNDFLDGLAPMEKGMGAEDVLRRAKLRDAMMSQLHATTGGTNSVEVATRTLWPMFSSALLEMGTLWNSRRTPVGVALDSGLDISTVTGAAELLRLRYGGLPTVEEALALAGSAEDIRRMRGEGKTEAEIDAFIDNAINRVGNLERHRSDREVTPMTEAEASKALQWVPRNPRDG